MDTTMLIAEGMEFNPLFSLVGMAIGAGVGYLIGKGKNREVLGAVLGAFLGCIGWIIVALLPKAGGPPNQ
ncbi:MAG: hypothetical protein AAB434_07575 [Planctomycetota bacterium]